MDSTQIPLLVDHVVKKYGTKPVLDAVSVSINPGEIFGLIGLNGAGKTTLIKIILGLLNADSGSVLVFGSNAAQPKTRMRFSFLPEKFQPSHLLKGHEFLQLTLSYYNKKYNPDAGRAMAEKLDLDPRALDMKITGYSKGMGQKLGLASAFLVDAPLLILDEPMSGLDPSARIKLKDTLLDYAKRGNTVFFSSHILSDIDEICQRITILHDRNFVFTGTPAEFRKNYQTDSLERAFLKSIQVIAA